MTTLHIVSTLSAGFAREDAPSSSVVGAYTNPEVADVVKRVAGFGAHVTAIEVDRIPPGLHQTMIDLGIKLPVLVKDELVVEPPVMASPIQAAAWLRDSLGLSMSQLASLADVTLAEAYAWFKGTSPHAPKAKNLMAMRAALEGVAPQTLRVLPQVWDYPLQGDSTLFKTLQTLDVPETAAVIAGALETLRPKLSELVIRSGFTKPSSGRGDSRSSDIYRDAGGPSEVG